MTSAFRTTPEEDQIIQTSVNHIAALAKDMPLRDSERFLRGVCLMSDDDTGGIARLRSAYVSLHEAMHHLHTPLEP